MHIVEGKYFESTTSRSIFQPNLTFHAKKRENLPPFCIYFLTTAATVPTCLIAHLLAPNDRAASKISSDG